MHFDTGMYIRLQWASCQIRKLTGFACAGSVGNVFPPTDFKVTHVPWCMSGSLTRGGGENVPGSPYTCTTHSLAYLVRDPLWLQYNSIASRLRRKLESIWNWWYRMAELIGLQMLRSILHGYSDLNDHGKRQSQDQTPYGIMYIYMYLHKLTDFASDKCS